MAQSGYTPILIYASGTATNVPLAANITSSASGAELALNYADGKLFYKDSGGVVQVLATKNTTAGVFSSNLTFTPDNTYDIGASGATRPRSLYLGTNAVIGGKVAINKTSATYSLDIDSTSSTDGIWLKRYNSSTRAFQATGDGVVSWGNGTTDFGQLTWSTGQTFVGGSAQLCLQTNLSGTTVNALILGTTGNGTFYGNVSIAGGNYFDTGSLGSRLWTPGLQIGTGTYAGLYGPALTYLASKSGSSWVSTGGGSAAALTIDEGYFSFARSNGVGGPGSALTWTTYLNSDSGGNFFFNSTGAVKVSSGTTAARPGADVGRIRWNTDKTQLEAANGTTFDKVLTEALITSATGGTITTDGDYKVHTFTSSGTFTVSSIAGVGAVPVQILVLGGGGAGGYCLGGGGGGGSMLEKVVNMTGASYTVTVGGGGSASGSASAYAYNGATSSITGGTLGTSCYAVGGGAGGNGTGDAFGANGSASFAGCGGGGASAVNFGTVTYNNVFASMGGAGGFNGSGGAPGSSYGSPYTFCGGGGGGGAIASGAMPNVGNNPVGNGGYGGSGRYSYISGSDVGYGGGGGGGYGSYLSVVGGGGGGGGNGAGSASTTLATAGTTNRGGGGGGGSNTGVNIGGAAGGSGIVIIRYKFQ